MPVSTFFALFQSLTSVVNSQGIVSNEHPLCSKWNQIALVAIFSVTDHQWYATVWHVAWQSVSTYFTPFQSLVDSQGKLQQGIVSNEQPLCSKWNQVALVAIFNVTDHQWCATVWHVALQSAQPSGLSPSIVPCRAPVSSHQCIQSSSVHWCHITVQKFHPTWAVILQSENLSSLSPTILLDTKSNSYIYSSHVLSWSMLSHQEYHTSRSHSLHSENHTVCDLLLYPLCLHIAYVLLL